MKETVLQFIEDHLHDRHDWDDGKHTTHRTIYKVWTRKDGTVQAHIGDQLVTITVDVQPYPA